jgi:hypothetical protein
LVTAVRVADGSEPEIKRIGDLKACEWIGLVQSLTARVGDIETLWP